MHVYRPHVFDYWRWNTTATAIQQVTWQDRGALYHILWHDIARHRLYGISQWYGDRPVQLHIALNLVKRKNLIATWHWCQLDRNYNHQISTSISEMLMTAYSHASAPSWTRSAVADGHKFSAVRRLSRKFYLHILQLLPASCPPPVWGDSIRIS